MDRSMELKFQSFAPMISNTPLLEIQYKYRGNDRRIFAKAEYYNLSGSIKDRVAFHILKKAYESHAIQKGDCIAEATSGNTGIAFSAMGGFLGSIQMTEELAKQGNVFLPRQFSNEDNVETHYLTTGEEIVRQLSALGLKADGTVAGVGTGGTVMGIGKRLREENPSCKVYPLEPSNSPTLSTGYRVGKHRIYGISDEFIPSIVKLNELDQVISVDDGDSIRMARMLSQQLGIGVGVSSGANFLGSVIAQERLGKDSVVATVFADDNKKYLSTDYSVPQPAKEGYLTNDIQLMNVAAYR